MVQLDDGPCRHVAVIVDDVVDNRMESLAALPRFHLVESGTGPSSERFSLAPIAQCPVQTGQPRISNSPGRCPVACRPGWTLSILKPGYNPFPYQIRRLDQTSVTLIVEIVEYHQISNRTHCADESGRSAPTNTRSA